MDVATLCAGRTEFLKLKEDTREAKGRKIVSVVACFAIKGESLIQFFTRRCFFYSCNANAEHQIVASMSQDWYPYVA